MGYIYPQAAFRIDGFSPPEKGQEFGRFGFCISLDAAFAKQCLATPRPKMERVSRIAETTVSRLFGEEPFRNPPINWWKDTCLIHGVGVPGNACDLTADYSEIERLLNRGYEPIDIGEVWSWALEYSPHNVDSARQAYGLLSVWLTWYNCVTATLLPVVK